MAVEYLVERRKELQAEWDEVQAAERAAEKKLLDIKSRRIEVEERQARLRAEGADFARRDKLVEAEENLAAWMKDNWVSDSGLEFLAEGIGSAELDSVVEAGPSKTDDSSGVAPGSTQNS